MPELPEVEILVRALDPQLSGRVIQGVEVRRERVVRPNSPAELAMKLTGRRIQRVVRRAKYLLFHLEEVSSQESRIVVGHLGMTGRMYLQPVGAKFPRHAAVIVHLDWDNLVFEDTRYFGRFHLDASVLSALGPEPLDETFTAEAFTTALKRSAQPVKVKLLDQTVVAGIGNIYASEALFRAGISPRCPANRLTRPQVVALRSAILEVLQAAIAGGSTLPLNFAGGRDGLFYYGTTTTKARGTYEERLWVYDRAGLPCLQCQTPVRQFVQAARSTYFCPCCQPG